MPPKFTRGSDYGSAKHSEKAALLDSNSDEEDFFLRGPNANPRKLLGQDRSRDPNVTRLQGQVDEVVDVMQTNIGKVLDRGERLEDLQDKSENLASNADDFRVKARGLKKHMWWKECRMRLLIAVVVIVILLIIIVPIIMKTRN